MSDSEIAAKIEELVAEERRLGTPGTADDNDAEPDRHARLEAVKVELDRCWDLLRQRRAREEFGLDPDAATARPADVVEGYEQ
jgi:hypothetical protein